MPSSSGTFIIAAVWFVIVAALVKLVYDVHRAMSEPAPSEEQKQRAREHYAAMKGKPPADQPDKKPPPKRYFGEP